MQQQRQTASIPDRNDAYVANGVIGLLVPEVPCFARRAFVSGFVALGPEAEGEEQFPAPYPLGLDLAVNGWWVSEYPSLAVFREQTLDFATGELVSRFDVRAPAATLEVEVLTFVSRTQPFVALQRTSVRADKPCRLVLRAQIDWRGHTGRLCKRVMTGRHNAPRAGYGDRDAIALWTGPGELSTLGLAYDSVLTGAEEARRMRNDYGHEVDKAETQYILEAQPGETCTLEQVASLVPSVRHPEPHWQAGRMVAHARWHGFDRLQEDNRAAWADLWRGRPVFQGAEPRWQDLSDACFFYTHSSTHASAYTGIPPFGLSHRNYKGHVFWDYESFMFPGVLLTAPHAARAGMVYRGRCLEMARHNAALHGLAGAQFPWQSGNTGAEVCTFYTSAREFHITPAVGFAVGQYLAATDDRLFLREHGWPILRGVAEWCAHFVVRTERGYETRHLASSNERFHDVDNDSQMHLFMIGALRAAAHWGRALGEPVPAVWEEIADHLFFPSDPETGSVVQFEGFPLATEPRASVGPLWGLFPIGHQYEETTEAATREAFLSALHT